MDNPVKLATQGTEDEEKYNKAQHSNGEHTIYYKTLVCIEWVTHMNLFSYRPTSVSLQFVMPTLITVNIG